MDKITEALTKLLPEEQVNEVTEAVQEEIGKAKKNLEQEYSTKLEQAYEELSEELQETENTALQGYKEAYAIIQDLRKRLEMQQAEFDAAMNEGYEEAYQMLQAEKKKNENIEVELYEQFNEKLQNMKEYMVDKVDQFLQYKGSEIYEQARRDVLNDPRMAEHKVALDRVVESVSGYLSNEDYASITNNKVEEATQEIENLKSQMRILEARNIRLSTENNKLQENVRRKQETLSENTKHTKKEREKKARNVQGRGRAVSDPELIAEWSNPEAEEKDRQKQKQDTDTTLVENLNPDFLREMQVLAGTKHGEE